MLIANTIAEALVLANNFAKKQLTEVIELPTNGVVELPIMAYKGHPEGYLTSISGCVDSDTENQYTGATINHFIYLICEE